MLFYCLWLFRGHLKRNHNLQCHLSQLTTKTLVLSTRIYFLASRKLKAKKIIAFHTFLVFQAKWNKKWATTGFYDSNKQKLYNQSHNDLFSKGGEKSYLALKIKNLVIDLCGFYRHLWPSSILFLWLTFSLQNRSKVPTSSFLL